MDITAHIVPSLNGRRIATALSRSGKPWLAFALTPDEARALALGLMKTLGAMNGPHPDTCGCETCALKVGADHGSAAK